MKIAILAVTDGGAQLAAKLSPKLNGGADIYVKTGRGAGVAAQHYDRLSDLVDSIYLVYDGLIFIMATGIAVRVLASHISDKRSDPAVVVMDEAGEFAISLLSGHIGGANELARTIGQAIGARPVITTATDVGGQPAADILAVKLGLAIEPFEELKAVNAASANRQKVVFFIDRSLAEWNHYYRVAEDMGITLTDFDQLRKIDYDAAVVISDKQLSMDKNHVFLRPATLAVGIGCRRGTTSDEIFAAMKDVCNRLGRSMKSIAVIATVTAKQDEVGILAVARQLKVPVAIFTNEELQKCIEEHQLVVSEFVQKQIGVGSVCEPAALLAGRTKELLLRKTIYGRITLAVTEVR